METLNTFYDNYSSLSEFVQNNHDALFGFERPAILVQIFSGRCEHDFLVRLSAEIAGLIPHARTIGTTTSGEIMNGQVSGLRTALSFSIFHHSTIKTGFILQGGQGDFELGQLIASELGSHKAKALIMFATGLSINAKDMLQGVQTVYPSLPVAGGNAGNNSLIEQSYVICDGQVIDSGVVGAVLEGEELTVNCYAHLGWQPIGKEMTITKAVGRRVYTIDHMPAYAVYRKYLGLDEIRNFYNVMEYPLIVKRHGIQTARTPDTRYNDESIGFAAELIEGEKVRFSYGHVGMISETVAGLCQEIKRQPVESIYVYSCECRRGFLQELSKIETAPLQEIAPTAGFFTHGEYYHVEGANQLLNATMTVLVLSESGKKTMDESPVTLIRTEPPRESCKSRVDNVVERNTGVLKALTHLVNTVTAELVSTNEKLAYISFHDALTGLYNRAFFEQEMKRFDALEAPVGIIMCDLSFLKLLNDVLGHDFGDKVLRLSADIIAKSCKDDVVARIGGDEFAILVANAELPMLVDRRNKILAEVANTKHIGNERLLYLSVGFALKSQDGIRNMDGAFRMADANMYRNKSENKTKVRKEIVHNLINITGEESYNKIVKNRRLRTDSAFTNY